MIVLKSPEEIEKLARANGIVAEALIMLSEEARPGVSTAYLDELARNLCRKKRVTPAFLGYNGFPAALCASINNEIVHGIPSPERILKEGDIVSLDFGVVSEGYVGDAAVTVPVGGISDQAAKLLRITEESLYEGIAAAVPGKRLFDIGAAVQKHVEAHGFSVVRDFVGHGIGRKMHEAPQVPNFGKAGTGMKLQEGMTLAIEPMVNTGAWQVRFGADGWTVLTQDGRPSAHFEHTIAIVDGKPEILTT